MKIIKDTNTVSNWYWLTEKRLKEVINKIDSLGDGFQALGNLLFTNGHNRIQIGVEEFYLVESVD